ncbi:retinol binding protein receptor-domain-containing protein [Halteromyces radiatus]|uniref:retinol binding protein receptor-domain-containing protein n=1 Tax=Halteromyces radiatus TaxID=101107 RepID=UPI00221FABE2|nr:retinol binding protein receptor-domain-containing protein [Halteromyces radiatus]KAI8100083.1 retinol binding protein receptor-domain-containing protein [Halteromyces radiatus]
MLIVYILSLLLIWWIDFGIVQGGDDGWVTRQKDDWIYYQQQYVNVSLSNYYLSIAAVGGCIGQNRYKSSGFLYLDDGHTFDTTGKKLTSIADEPLIQTVAINTSYMQYFVDDYAMNLTFLPSWEIPDKQAVIYEISFDRAIVVTFQFYDLEKRSISNLSTGVLIDSLAIPDVTLPPLTRYIEKLSHRVSPISMLVFIPTRFLSRQPSHPVLLCIFLMIGSFIFTQAWNVINSQSSIFHEWLPRAAKIIELFLSFFLYAVYFYPLFLCYHASINSRIANIFGCYCVIVLFGLRVTVDLPSYVITYARDLPFLILNAINAIFILITNFIVITYFIVRSITFQPCDLCHLEFLQVKDIEETYVKQLFMRNHPNKIKKVPPLLQRIKSFYRQRSWKTLTDIEKLQYMWKIWMKKLLGINEHIRIPYPVKISLSILLFCLGQLVPVVLIQLLGVGGTVPTHICLWSPYLAQLQYQPNPMKFAEKTFLLMKIAVYLTVLGAGGYCMIYTLGIFRRVTKDITNLRRGNYGLFKGKKNNDIDLDDAIRFMGVCIGFGFTGTLYCMLEIAIIGVFVVMVIQLERARDYVLSHLGYGAFFASFFIAFIVQMIQKRITRILFLSKESHFEIKNRSPLLHYWYFMMFTSMTRALTSYVLRTLKLLLRYPLFSVRVDRNAETWSVRRGDGGFIGYCGMLKAEHYFNNPVVLVFIECILHRMVKKQRIFGSLCQKHYIKLDLEKTTSKKPSQVVSNSVASCRARTRWFLAITLINNPVLRRARRSINT